MASAACALACTAILGAGLVGCAAPSATELTIFAASSLSSAFDDLATVYPASHDGVELIVNHGASQALRIQIREGAYADVYVSADTLEMERAADDGIVEASAAVTFARNRLAILLAPGNPARLELPTDIARQDVRIALADSSIPLGRYTLMLLEVLGGLSGIGSSFPERVHANTVSFELTASGVLGKVLSGEVDAGIGYASDLAGGGSSLSEIPLPEGVSPMAAYQAAPVLTSVYPALGMEFVAWLLSPEAQEMLRDSGFLAPGGG